MSGRILCSIAGAALIALAVIPARGGSKQVPRKNLKLLGGKPLIQWSIEAAQAASELDRCIVSTDDEEIAAVARALGAEVPFLRPAEYAQDTTPDLPVFQHALAWLAEHEGYRPAMVVHLRGRRVPGAWIAASNYGAWALVSALVAWLVLR